MPLTFICAFCGKEKTVAKWVNRVKKRYCSRKCYGKDRSRGTYKPWNKGKKGSQTAWNKGLTLKDYPGLARKRGEDSPNWKGGKKTYRQAIMAHSEFIHFRQEIFKRDNFTCQICGQWGGKLRLHHLKPFATHQELFFVPSNCQTVCLKCHIKIHTKQLSSNRAKYA